MTPDELAALQARIKAATSAELHEEARLSGLSRAEINALAAVLMTAQPHDVPSIRNLHDFERVMEALHRAIEAQTRATTRDPREVAKKRRRHILQAATSGTAGAGLLTTNAVAPALLPLSFAFSIAALVQAARDLLEAAELDQ